MRKALLFFPPFLAIVIALIPCLSPAAESAAETAPGAEFASALLANLPVSWEGWITLVVTVCAALSAVWPRPKEDAPILWRWLYTVVNALGCNAGKAKNADDAKAKAARLG